MKFRELLNIGATVLGTANPVVAGGIKIINTLLPEDKKLPESASNGQVLDAASSLSPDHRLALMEKELDIELAEIQSHTDNLRVLADVDKSGSSTRPYIALMMSWVIVLSVLPVSWAYAYSLIANKADLMQSISQNYMILLVLLGTPIWVVRAYFGHRTEEKKARYALSANQTVAQNQSVLGAIVGAMMNGKK